MTGEKTGLSYNTEVIGNLVNKDTDQDDVLDWEESLWGTDPNNKDTDNDGVQDDIEIENLKRETSQNPSEELNPSVDEEKLTATDKFSRELFTTVATLNQNGALDQTTVDKLSSSLVEQIQNPDSEKIYILSQIKILNNETPEAIKNYQNNLGVIFAKNKVDINVTDILAESMSDGENINAKVLNKLDPIIKYFNGITGEMLLMYVPKSLAVLHLDTMNAFQKVVGNLSNMKLVDTDVILAIGAISQYESSDTELRLIIEKLITEINKKLSN